jgi:hypothetical protein
MRAEPPPGIRQLACDVRRNRWRDGAGMDSCAAASATRACAAGCPRALTLSSQRRERRRGVFMGRQRRTQTPGLRSVYCTTSMLPIVESRFAVGQVELPDVHEALIKPGLQHLGCAAPGRLRASAAGFGVVGAKGKFVHHHQPGGLRLRRNSRGQGRQPPGKDVLLDEVGGADVALQTGRRRSRCSARRRAHRA